MILSLGFRFDASKMCDWCHGTCNTVTCYNHHTMNYSECFQIILWMRLLSAGCITTPARQWPGPRPDSGARPDSQTWCWNQEEDDCLVSILLQRIFSPCISGFHSPKNTSEIWTQFENNSIRIGNDSSATNEPNSRSVFCFFL